MAARTCAECAHAHARDTRSLRSLVGSPEAPTFPPQDATNTTETINQHKQAQESLARSARSWAPLRLRHSLHKTSLARFARSCAPLRLPIRSGPPPAPALATLGWASCFLRAGETPALRQQGMGRGCAIANPPPWAPFPPVPLPLARSARSMPLRAACLLPLRGPLRAWLR